MIYILWIFLILVFSLKFHKADQIVPSINLIASLSSRNLILVCDVKSDEAISSNIYLNCPFVTGGVCYSNCKPICQSPNDCLPLISNCSIEKIKQDNVRLKWSIDVTFINKTGDWKCSYQTIISNSIPLEKYSAKHNINNFTKEPSNKSRTANDAIQFPIKPKFENPKVSKDNNNYYYSGYVFWQFITQPNIVLIIFCIFTVSLILNIIFLIRCALFRSVIDNYLQSKKSPNSCIFRCFCIPVNQDLPIVNVKSFIQTVPSVYGGYHREEIYDDISSGSQADRNLINNYSHYEQEHDAFLSRKLWSPEGSYNLANIQSHVCPGQGLGNYVIVSGPVCTNRNYMPLNTPSNTSLLSNSQHTYTTEAVGRSPSKEFQRQEYSIGSDNIIYSKPMKNKAKSFDNGSYNNPNNSMPVSPTDPIEKYLSEPVQNTNLTTVHIPMKNVDIIEHYTHTLTAGAVEKNSKQV